MKSAIVYQDWESDVCAEFVLGNTKAVVIKASEVVLGVGIAHVDRIIRQLLRAVSGKLVQSCSLIPVWLLSKYQSSNDSIEIIMRIVTVVAVIGALAACAIQEPPQPTVTVRTQDTNLDCTMIRAEIQANNAKATELANEQGWTFKQWYRYGKDFKYEAEKEAAALNARQEYLAALAAERCAPPSAPQLQPQRQPRAKS